MAREVSLSQLRTDVASQCDFVTSSAGRYTPTLLNRLINQAIQRFRERLSGEGMNHYLVATSGTITAGATSPFSFRQLDLSAVTPPIVRTCSVELTVSNQVRTLAHRPFEERNDFGGAAEPSTPIAWAHYQTAGIALFPPPDQTYSYTVWYLPVLADLVEDSDTFDGVSGWEDYVVWDVVARLINRDQYAAAYQMATQQKAEIWADILRNATRVTSAGGAHVGRDTFGQAGLLRRTRSLPAAGSGGSSGGGGGVPASNSITNSQLVDMLEARFKLRPLAAGTGSPVDGTGAQANEILPKFAGGLPGLVPTGTGNSADSLRGDGSWGNSATSASGLSLSQLAPIAGPRFVGLFAGPSAAPGQLTPRQAQSMLATFSGINHGLVPGPTGGALGRALFDDGLWKVIPTGVVAPSGIGLGQLGPILGPGILGNAGQGSGAIARLTGQQVASMIGVFTGLAHGLVPYPSGAALTDVLNADGKWRPGVGAGGAVTLGGPTGAVQYNGGTGLAGVAGFSFDGTNLSLDGELRMPGRFQLQQDGRLALPNRAFPTGLGDKLGAWTASGFASSATGIAIAGSGMALAFGPRPATTGDLRHTAGTLLAYRSADALGNCVALRGGAVGNDLWIGDTASGMNITMFARTDILMAPAGIASVRVSATLLDVNGLAMQATGAHRFLVQGTQRASIGSGGLDLLSGDAVNIKKLNGLEGVKVYGPLDGTSASGSANITAPSGSAFIIPAAATAGQRYALVPSGANHGDSVLIQNRSSATHRIFNHGTGMGAPSGALYDMAPSGGAWFRFASGAWEFGSRYQLGGGF